MATRHYWIVFCNDWPLSVCLSEEHAERETARQKELERCKVVAYLGALAATPSRVEDKMRPLRFHWYAVAEAADE